MVADREISDNRNRTAHLDIDKDNLEKKLIVSKERNHRNKGESSWWKQSHFLIFHKAYGNITSAWYL